MRNTRLGTTCHRCGVFVPRYSRVQGQTGKGYTYPKYCDSCRPLRAWPSGEQHSRWKGGKTISEYGYVVVVVEENGRKRRRFEHQVVWERANGPIPPRHHIHHRNHVKTDNRLENLELLSPAEHNRRHFKITRWSLLHDRCIRCGSDDSPHAANGLCNRCRTKDNWAKAKAAGKPWANRGHRVSAWADRHERCIECGSTESRHKGHGLCRKCYDRRFWHAHKSPKGRDSTV